MKESLKEADVVVSQWDMGSGAVIKFVKYKDDLGPQKFLGVKAHWILWTDDETAVKEGSNVVC